MVLEVITDASQAKKLISVDFTWMDSTTIAVHRHGSGALKKKEIK